MVASDEWTEWHLTPRGWERGSEKIDLGKVVSREAPSDRVMTARYAVVLGHPVPQVNTVLTVWESADDQMVRSLMDRFGPTPAQL